MYINKSVSTRWSMKTLRNLLTAGSACAASALRCSISASCEAAPFGCSSRLKLPQDSAKSGRSIKDNIRFPADSPDKISAKLLSSLTASAFLPVKSQIGTFRISMVAWFGQICLSVGFQLKINKGLGLQRLQFLNSRSHCQLQVPSVTFTANEHRFDSKSSNLGWKGAHAGQKCWQDSSFRAWMGSQAVNLDLETGFCTSQLFLWKMNQ